MKKKLFCIVLAALLLLSLSGCAKPTSANEHLEDYIFMMQYHDDFNILQLTDIHFIT